MGFAIPIDQARGLVEQILTYGKVVRPVLGITIAPPQLARQVGEEGVLVLEVPAGTPADKAGFKGTYRCARMLHAFGYGGVARFLKLVQGTSDRGALHVLPYAYGSSKQESPCMVAGC